MPGVLIRFENQSQNYAFIDASNRGSYTIADVFRIKDCNTSIVSEWTSLNSGIDALSEEHGLLMHGNHLYVVGFGSNSDGWTSAYTATVYPVISDNPPPIDFTFRTESSLVGTCSDDITEPTGGNVHNVVSMTVVPSTGNFPEILVPDANLNFFELSIGIIMAIAGITIMIWLGKRITK